MEHDTKQGKSCTKCKIFKPFADFPFISTRNRYQPYCKQCDANSARRLYHRKMQEPSFRSERVKKLRLAYEHNKAEKRCGDCGQPVTDGKVFCAEHRELRRRKEQLRRDVLPPRLCKSCGMAEVKGRSLLCQECGKLPERRR